MSNLTPPPPPPNPSERRAAEMDRIATLESPSQRRNTPAASIVFGVLGVLAALDAVVAYDEAESVMHQLYAAVMAGTAALLFVGAVVIKVLTQILKK